MSCRLFSKLPNFSQSFSRLLKASQSFPRPSELLSRPQADNIAWKGRVLQGASRECTTVLDRGERPGNHPGKKRTPHPSAGGQYCVERSGFARREPRECTTVLDRGERPSNHPGKKRTPHPSAGGQYCVERSGFARREPRECTTVLDRGERRSKARDFPQDCSPYMTMMPNTRANSATVSTIPQMVR